MHQEFQELLSRVKAGDEAAAYELVKTYEPMVRAVIRNRLRDPVMKRHFDSMDICQSVMATLFPRFADERLEVEEPKQLVGLLVQITKNKLNHHLRKQRQQCRDAHAVVSSDDSAFNEPVDDVVNPERVASAKEELEQLYKLLGQEERQMAELRGKGKQWGEIAEVMGGTAEGRRKQFQRAIASAVPLVSKDE